MRKLAVCCSSFFQFQNFPGNFSLARTSQANKFPGGLTARVTPVPIPNTEVKPCRADDTARVTARERRSPPGLKFKGRNAQSVRGLFYFYGSLSFSYSVSNNDSQAHAAADFCHHSSPRRNSSVRSEPAANPRTSAEEIVRAAGLRGSTRASLREDSGNAVFRFHRAGRSDR